MSVGVVSIIYEEPEWKQTKKCIQRLNLPVVYVDRNGVGSLSKAFNRGFDKLLELHPDLKYVWMISNVVFNQDVLSKIIPYMEEYDCIHPSFNSDHMHIRPQFYSGVKPVPFVEFTAPVVKVETFKKFPLDEELPYWGQDLSWGYEVRQAGGKIGVHYGTQVRHEYIRHKVRRKPLPVTKTRQRLRKETNHSTRERLRTLYGDNWGQVLESGIH
jgi:hypothetical protein